MRIFIADDQPNVRYALRVLLSGRPDLIIAGEALDAYELQNKLAETDPDMVIVDWLLPGLVEIGSLSELRQQRAELIIIALSSRPELGLEAILGGADAFVSKIDPPEKLLTAIDSFEEPNEYTPLGVREG